MKLQGKLLKKDESAKIYSEKFRKREFVLETNETYPQTILITLINDGCDLIDDFNVDDSIEVSINIRGKEWTNPTTNDVRYFNTIQGWSINKIEESDTSLKKEDYEEVTKSPVESEDDLPF
ncbi:MAG: hypothetical protein Unbinned2903contig1001_9 [Prokaryotic dsDNA virus sp.]|nr:MAG: hypothetical protein Unbinned2903contig1001_9 [Prokaryotic dsDNA virus sp.]|tara:strand:+ start:2891 stop:3253 length:363 start_codon:yes stop_codon:yes gene_type:complete